MSPAEAFLIDPDEMQMAAIIERGSLAPMATPTTLKDMPAEEKKACCAGIDHIHTSVDAVLLMLPEDDTVTKAKLVKLKDDLKEASELYAPVAAA